MIGNLKILGLALSVIIALSAITAMAALAQQGKLTSDGPVTLTATETGIKEVPLTLTGTQTGAAGSNALTTFGGKVECSTATYKGHKYNVTPHALISTGTTQITITPQYGKCTLFGKPATVDMNGCDYVFDIEGTTGVDEFGVTTTIACPKEQHVQVTMFESEAKHTEANSFCMLTITENAAGYAGLNATDTTNGFIDINGTIKEILVHEKSKSALCAEATSEGSELDFDIKIEGKTSGGAVKAISISDDGKLTWRQLGSGLNAWTMFGLKVECPESTYTGHQYNVTPHSHISSGSTSITLTPHYNQANHNCLIEPANWPTTINMNGCDYVLHLGVTTGGGAGTYGVTTDIVCPEGQQIAWKVWTSTADETSKPNEPFCVVHIPPQTGLGGAHATDTGNGYIDITGAFEGTKAVRTKSASHPVFCPASETSSGKFDIDITVKGINAAGGATSISLSD
jgi:hypothetical protein